MADLAEHDTDDGPVIDTDVIRDQRLSPAALGVYVYLRYREHGGPVQPREETDTPRHAAALRQLVSLGYVAAAGGDRVSTARVLTGTRPSRATAGPPGDGRG